MDIIMPKMGESVSEGTILKWHKKKGDTVKRDEIIFEISTDKVDSEIPSPADGVLSEILFNEGDTVEVGTVVAVISSAGEVAEEAAARKPETGDRKTEGGVKTEKKNDRKEAEANTSERNNTTSELIEIAMPKMGESVMEGTIIKWHKKVGEAVKKDETIFEISTDKVDTEVPSPEDGILAEILVGEQETVAVGTIVAKLSASGGANGKISYVQPAETKIEPIADRQEEKPASAKKETTKFLSPLVMNILQKENISYDELDAIDGTGTGGRINKKDILNYIEEKRNRKTDIPAEVVHEVTGKTEYDIVSSRPVQSSKVQTVYSSSEVERIPMDNVRQKIMQHMINSRDTSVHVSAMLEADVTRIYNFLKNHRDEILKKEGVKLTYMPFIAHACIKALKEFPLVNSTIDGYTIIKKKYINLGIAVAVDPAGLVVPNIKSADEKNIFGLARAINDLAERARTKKLVPDDITNGTFTITNYGVFGTIFGTPIINQPEVAILGVGTVVKKPVVVEVDGTDTIAIKPTMAITLSHDHRLVDGMLGGRFLKSIKDTLESFNENSL